MNTAQHLPHDYRSQMQSLALAFVITHQAEHLGDPDQLAERTACHLVHQHGVPLFMAPRLVALAISELPPPALNP